MHANHNERIKTGTKVYSRKSVPGNELITDFVEENFENCVNLFAS
jgi:hypothetical protein